MSNTGAVAVTSSNSAATQVKETNAWHEFDILAAVVSRYQNAAPKKPQSPEHRISCHRCGNIRKRRILCTRSTCPHTFCGRCAEKMKEEHGLDVFFGGCPVCKELCCCNNKSVFCHRKNHCYRKCPATKTNGKNPAGACCPVKDDSDSEPYVEEHMSIPKPENGQYGIFDLLAAVADMDKTNPTLGKTKIGGSGGASSSSGTMPKKKAKLTKETSSSSAAPNKSTFSNTMLLCEPSFTPYYSSATSGLQETSNLQLLHNSKQSPNLTGTSQTVPLSLSGDSGVDGYTFNNNTMGIIRGGINGVDAITLMGQQKQKYSGMDKLGNMPLTSENLLSGVSTTAGTSTTANSSSSGGNTLTSSIAPSTLSNMNMYNRLPSIDSNPFSTTAVKDASRATATFDQALLDSVRNIQPDAYHLPLPSVPRSLNPPVTASESLQDTKHHLMSNAALEPMNLLALVSSFTQSIDKGLPSDRPLLSGAEELARTARAITDSTKRE